MKENIIPINIKDKMEDAYLSYSLSVIASRALPDVKDGLKPVHRRILYAAKELNLVHTKPHKKSARIVGEVLGKYHPHGDTAVYNAMVRMAQDFNQRYPLIDGHGNFGSIDGDSPAAMRYTEARLTSTAESLLEDIDQKTVNFIDNFDGSLKEPVVLPTKVPNLLVNGSSGIAVGMSTDIPPHNLQEVINALIYLLKQPNAQIKTLMKYIPGPDFPTGGKIIGNKGIEKAYKTGTGQIKLRAKLEVEQIKRKKQIVITEIPYQQNKSHLLEKIAEAIDKNNVTNITELRDESGQEGLRIVLEIKNGADTNIIFNQLYKHTPLQTNYRINMLALDNNEPKVMDIKTILQHFLCFRQEVITKRVQHKLQNAQDKYHILQGLITAINNLDKVISVIRKSKSNKKAINSLKTELNIDEDQAKAILQMRLQRLVAIEINKLHEESKELSDLITKYKKILNNKEELNNVLKKELFKIKKTFKDERRTIIIEDDSEAEITKSDLIKKKKAVVSLSYQQNIKRTDSIDYVRAGKDDYILYTAEGNTLDTLLFITNSGEAYTLAIHTIEEHHGLSTGELLKKYLKIPLKEKIISVICLNKENLEQYITICTKQGQIKKTLGKEYITSYSSIKAIKLSEGDQVVSAVITNNNKEILLGTQQRRTIRFDESTVSDTGRNTLGNKGIKLKDDDKVVSMNIIDDNDTHVVTISTTGKGKKTPISEYTLQNRNGVGLKTCGADAYQIAGVITVKKDEQILLVTNKKNTISINTNEINETDRTGNMYQITSLEGDEKI
ncbi:MAG: DNA gyrase subunit A, partial [bacterium]